VTKSAALKVVRAYEKLMSFEAFVDQIDQIIGSTEDLSEDFINKLDDLTNEELTRLNQVLADM
jgi:hypothetical protein